MSRLDFQKFLQSLAFKVGLHVLFFEAVTLAVIGMVYITFSWRRIDQQVEVRTSIPGSLIAQGILDLKTVSDKEAMERMVGRDLVTLVDGMIVGITGNIFYALNPERVGQNVDEVPGVPARWFDSSFQRTQRIETSADGRRYLVNITPVLTAEQRTPYLFAYFKADISQAYRYKRRLAWFYVSGALLAVMLTTTFIHQYMRRSVFKRMQHILDVVSRVRQGDFTARVQHFLEHDEISKLQEGINAMTQELEANVGHLRDRLQALQSAESEIRQLNEQLEARVARRTEELEHANRELEAFTYSVSHDLRAPLRSLNGFSLALLEDVGETLDPESRDNLIRIRIASQRMAEMMDALLSLSRLSRQPMTLVSVNMSHIAQEVIEQLREESPERSVAVRIHEGLVVQADPHLCRILLDNLLGNAWKFTRCSEQPSIEFGFQEKNLKPVFYVRDNGAGFDMRYSEKLFQEFQRIHSEEVFEGTGLGLATVRRIVHRHGGNVWAEGETNRGATFYFTLGDGHLETEIHHTSG